jgi:Cu(I)/Ag(I) efflux system protein CusF
MNALLKLTVTMAIALSATSAAQAQQASHVAHHHASAAGSAAAEPGALAESAVPLVNAEVKRVDVDAKKITLKHEALPNLGMSGMTMVFRVKDPALLDQVKPGDQVRFFAENIDGALTVVQLRPMK